MNATKHTSEATTGPWTVDGLRIIRNGTQPTGLFNVASCADPTAGQTDGAREEREANAALIAAAPDLLHACKTALNMLEAIANKLGALTADAGCETRMTRAELEIAIRKAVGG